MGKLIKNFIKSMASLTIYPDPREITVLRRDFPKPRSTEDAWREDWNKIGADFSKVLSREQKNR